MVMFTPEEITGLRQRLKLSVAEFAEKLGVHRTTVYYWENGHSHPRYKELIQLNKLANQTKDTATA